MSRPDPIQYAERLYSAIRAANFSPMSFLAFGNAVKEGVAMRSMPRIAAEPFMRIVGEMLDLEEETAGEEIIDADIEQSSVPPVPAAQTAQSSSPGAQELAVGSVSPSLEPSPQAVIAPPPRADRRRSGGGRS